MQNICTDIFVRQAVPKYSSGFRKRLLNSHLTLLNMPHGRLKHFRLLSVLDSASIGEAEILG